MSKTKQSHEKNSNRSCEIKYLMLILPVALAINLDQGSPMAGVDLVPGVHAQFYLHDEFLL